MEHETGDLEARFARRLRQIRETMELSQAELARRMTELGYRMHQTAIAKLEHGERPIRLNEAGVLAYIVNCQLTDLVDIKPPEDVAGLMNRARFGGYLEEMQQLLARALDEAKGDTGGGEHH